MSNDLETFQQIVNVVAGAVSLAARLDINMRDVSAAISAGDDDGMTRAAFADLVAAWHETDARERAAYRDRLSD